MTPAPETDQAGAWDPVEEILSSTALALSEDDMRWRAKTIVQRVREQERNDIADENIRLRAALAQSGAPCAYCSLSREDWAKCQHGFPGCARADDAMGCPELGARLEAEQLRAELAAIRARTEDGK